MGDYGSDGNYGGGWGWGSGVSVGYGNSNGGNGYDPTGMGGGMWGENWGLNGPSAEAVAQAEAMTRGWDLGGMSVTDMLSQLGPIPDQYKREVLTDPLSGVQTYTGWKTGDNPAYADYVSQASQFAAQNAARQAADNAAAQQAAAQQQGNDGIARDLAVTQASPAPSPYGLTAGSASELEAATRAAMAAEQEKATKGYIGNVVKGLVAGLATGGIPGAAIGGLVAAAAPHVKDFVSSIVNSVMATGTVTPAQEQQLADAALADPGLAAALDQLSGNGNGNGGSTGYDALTGTTLAGGQDVVSQIATGTTGTGAATGAGSGAATGGAGTGTATGTYPFSKNTAEEQYRLARDQIMDAMPRGGQLLDSLANTDAHKARTILTLENQSYLDKLNRDLSLDLAKMGANVTLQGQASSSANYQQLIQQQKDIQERQQMLDLFSALGSSGIFDSLFG